MSKKNPRAERIFGSKDPSIMLYRWPNGTHSRMVTPSVILYAERVPPPRLSHPHNPLLQVLRDATEFLQGDEWYREVVAFYDSLDDHINKAHGQHAEKVLWGLMQMYQNGQFKEDWNG